MRPKKGTASDGPSMAIIHQVNTKTPRLQNNPPAKAKAFTLRRILLLLFFPRQYSATQRSLCLKRASNVPGTRFDRGTRGIRPWRGILPSTQDRSIGSCGFATTIWNAAAEFQPG